MIINEGIGQEYSIEFKWVKPSDGQLFEEFDSDNRTISLTKIDGVPIYVNSPEGCNLLDFTGGNVRIHRRYYVDVVGVLMGSYEVQSYLLYYRGGRLEIVNHINGYESEEQQRRLVGTVFYDSGCSENEDGICSAAESQGSQRRYYVPIVKVNFMALLRVLERDVIPFVRRYSFMPEDGSIFVELAEASVKISFFPNLRTFSPYWEDNLVRSSTYKKAAIFYLRGRPIRIQANRDNPHVELTESNETYSFITVGAPEWLDETYDTHIWEYDLVDGQLVPVHRLK